LLNSEESQPMNQNPLWKNLLIILVVLIATVYALPNLFGEDPAVQISPAYASETVLTESVKESVVNKLKEKNFEYSKVEFTPQQVLVRFKDTDTQLKAYTWLKDEMKGYVVAQNLAPAVPTWLSIVGAKPMYLGLDLRGGVHFLLQIDMKAALQQDEEQIIEELRSLFREKNIRYKGLSRVAEEKGGIRVSFGEEAVRDQANEIIQKEYNDLIIHAQGSADAQDLLLQFTDQSLKDRRAKAVEQNTTTLRNRINELGVAEPIIQQQGEDRIVVQLPGVQDTARAKEILGATATLEFRLVEGEPEQWMEAQRNNKVPPNARLYKRRDGSAILLKRQVIVTGDQINDASSTIEDRSGRPATVVRLDNKGAKRMLQTTSENVQKPMAVVFIEYKPETTVVNGQKVTTHKKAEEVINVATIQEAFGKNFQITGLTSNEARNLALLLRAGALKAPMEIVEERTIGPSLGKENIEQGMIAVLGGMLAVVIFMILRYSMFGLIANIALFFNLILLVAALSSLQATLTLPGIAGIVLTLGMSVDANVLIFERINEEIHNGNSPQASISAGFEKAFLTIFDSNLTTLIAALMLYAFGSGPVRGFAVTLSLGIITSMFTAITITRAIINFSYGGRKLQKLPL